MAEIVDPLPELSLRDCEILRGLVNDESPEEIGDRLKVSAATIAHYTDKTRPESLQNKWGVETTKRLYVNWSNVITIAAKDLDTFLPNPADLEYARITGNARQVVESAGKGVTLLQSYVDLFPTAPSADVVKRISELLPIYGLAFYDTSTPQDVRKKLPTIIGELDQMVEALNDGQSRTMSDLLKANWKYVDADAKRDQGEKNTDYKSRQQHVANAWNRHSFPDKYTEITTLAMHIVGAGLLKDEAGITQGENRLREMELSSSMERLLILQSKARAYGFLGNSKGAELIDQAWTVYDNIQSSGGEIYPLEIARLTKATLEVDELLPQIFDDHFLENRGVEGLDITRKAGIQRHSDAIEQHLYRRLNYSKRMVGTHR